MIDMERIKVLNLYAGIGGNRKLWKNVEVTAVELNPRIAAIYQELFPNDKVIIGDAHQYLLEHYEEFDFIWTSPPCPTHSCMNNFLNAQGVIRYPAMELWQEIIFLKHFFKGKFVIENVRSYYEPFIKPQESQRHYFWANFIIPNLKKSKNISVTNSSSKTRRTSQEHIDELQKHLGIDVSRFKQFGNSVYYKLLANCVKPEVGSAIFNAAFREKQKSMSDY